MRTKKPYLKYLQDKLVKEQEKSKLENEKYRKIQEFSILSKCLAGAETLLVNTRNIR